jgi:integrase
MSPYKDPKSGRWYADYVDENGKRQRPSLGELARTMKQAEEVERRLKARVDEIRLGLAVRDRNPEGHTVRSAMDWYLAGPAARQKNAKSLGYTLKKHIVDPLSSMRIDVVKPGHVADWLDEREDSEELSARTVNRLRAYLMGMFTRLIQRDLLIGENPVKRTEKREEEDPPPRLMPAAVVPVIIDNAASKGWRLIFLLAAYEGMRRAEIRRLRAEHVDIARGTILIMKTKSRKARLIPVHQAVRADLEAAVKHGGVIVPKAAWGQSGAVTRAAMERGGEKAPEGTQACFHSLRHTFITTAVECGAEPWAVEWIAHGPRQTSTMEKTYLKPMESLARELAKLEYPRPAKVLDLPAPHARAQGES